MIDQNVVRELAKVRSIASVLTLADIFDAQHEKIRAGFLRAGSQLMLDCLAGYAAPDMKFTELFLGNHHAIERLHRIAAPPLSLTVWSRDGIDFTVKLTGFQPVLDEVPTRAMLLFASGRHIRLQAHQHHPAGVETADRNWIFTGTFVCTGSLPMRWER